MMRVIFARIATQELEDTVRFYDLESTGLGERFKEEVRKAAVRIAELLYSVEEDHILVIAVAHQHRRPDYWVGTDET